MPAKWIKILGISFLNGSAEEVVAAALRGGLVVVPSGPGLSVDLRRNTDYRRAVTEADLAVTDSGAMVLFWRLFRRQRVKRVSGLHLLERILENPSHRKPGAVFWVHPSEREKEQNCRYLSEQQFTVRPEDHAVAPFYPATDLKDEPLFEQIRSTGASVVVLGIGGGVQERLGYWLRSRFHKADLPCPAILCTGAAIGFLSGNQVRIPVWADRLYLGWLLRCLSNPKKFVPRYWSAIPLAYLIARYGGRLPKLINDDR